MCQSLVNKYNVAGPRYTSYPTVPYWNIETFSLQQWTGSLRKSFNESNATEGLSLYLHLPFCESLCTFCGCHKRITKRHEVEIPYIKALLKEWDLYRAMLGGKPKIKELHLGEEMHEHLSFATEKLRELDDIKHRDYTKYDEYKGHWNNMVSDRVDNLTDEDFTKSVGVEERREIQDKILDLPELPTTTIGSFPQTKEV